MFHGIFVLFCFIVQQHNNLKPWYAET